jgi:cell wall assembly regulator SMI1
MKTISDIYNSPQSLVESYICGLRNAYIERGGKTKWEEFEKVVEGASEDNILKLKELYPMVPDSLIELLSYVDGTYHRKYNGRSTSLYSLGSRLEEYPYYLLSSEQIIENVDLAYDYYSEFVDREFDPEDVSVDDRIINNSEKMKWLHFSDCMNNGGSSQLFIDFSPSESGKEGQVVMFLHDPDQLEVIADSFDEYLEKLIRGEFNFVLEDDF